MGDAQNIESGFRRYLLAAGIFSLAYFSFGFLLLRAHAVGFAARDVVLLYALFNVAFVATAPLIGKLGDHVGQARIIVLGYATYLAMSLGFAFATAKWQIIVLFVAYGVFYSIDEAQSKAFISDIELERRASAIGIYDFVTGLLYVPASLIAGALWVSTSHQCLRHRRMSGPLRRSSHSPWCGRIVTRQSGAQTLVKQHCDYFHTETRGTSSRGATAAESPSGLRRPRAE